MNTNEVVSAVVSCKAHPGMEDVAVDAIETLVTEVARNEPGALVYAFHRNLDDSAEMVLFEAYVDQAAAAAHHNSPHMTAFRERFVELFEPSSAVAKRLERIAAHSQPSVSPSA